MKSSFEAGAIIVLYYSYARDCCVGTDRLSSCHREHGGAANHWKRDSGGLPLGWDSERLRLTLSRASIVQTAAERSHSERA